MIIASFLILLLPLLFFQIFLYQLGSEKPLSDGYNLWQGDMRIVTVHRM